MRGLTWEELGRNCYAQLQVLMLDNPKTRVDWENQHI
jgi:hypothetical protein